MPLKPFVGEDQNRCRFRTYYKVVEVFCGVADGVLMCGASDGDEDAGAADVAVAAAVVSAAAVWKASPAPSWGVWAAGIAAFGWSGGPYWTTNCLTSHYC